MGFSISKDGITYREYAPGAVDARLIGEFSKFSILVFFFRVTFIFNQNLCAIFQLKQYLSPSLLTISLYFYGVNL